jgi:hypothetical protein
LPRLKPRFYKDEVFRACASHRVGGGMDTNIYCLPPAGALHSQNKVINAPAAHNGGGRGIGLRWYVRFKLIRLRRISLATLPRYGRALRIGWAEGEGKGGVRV